MDTIFEEKPTPALSETYARRLVAFKNVASVVFFAVLPVLVLGIGLRKVLAGGNLGLDFRGELYPEAQFVLHGANPFPSPDAVLDGSDRIYPIPAALLVSPLTVLPVVIATYVWCLVSLVALAATLRVLGVTDWRVYGIVALWPPTIAELQTGNLTILLALLVALAWKLRERPFAPGVAIGLAVALKLFLWPLGVWLLARRRFRSAAVAAGMAVAGTLLVLPFESLTSYVDLMGRMKTAYGLSSYNLVGLLSQAGVSNRRFVDLVACSIGLAVLALAAYRRSLPLTVAASLLLSPIVWLHYFVLLIIPLALRWPRFASAWAIPLLFWFCVGVGAQERDIVLGLLIFTTVVAASEFGELPTLILVQQRLADWRAWHRARTTTS